MSKKQSLTKRGKNSLEELRRSFARTKINIKAGKEKNTNAHKPIKKKIAQELTRISINNLKEQ